MVKQSEFQTLSNEAQEFAARAAGALSFDFANAVDQLPIMRMREQYSHRRGCASGNFYVQFALTQQSAI